jgi:hypothetical protein
MNNLNEHINRMRQLIGAKHGMIKPLVSEQISLSAEDLPFPPTDIDDPDAGFGYDIKPTVDPKSYLSSKGYTDNSSSTVEFTNKIVNEMGFQIDDKYKKPIDPVFYKEFENGKYRIQVFIETEPFSHKSEISLFKNGQKIAGENFNHKEVKMFPNDPNSGWNVHVPYDEIIESIERMISKYDIK